VKRLAAVLGLAFGLFAGAAFLGAVPASAHPLGNFTVNRYSGLDLAPGGVTVTYVLDMAEIPTYQAMPAIDTNGDGTASPAERAAWANREAPAILSNLRLAVGDRPVGLRTVSATMVFRAGQAGLPILRLSASFVGPLGSSTGSVSYRDGNFADRIGWKEITARSETGVSLSALSVPSVSVSHALLAYPKDLLSSPLDVTETAFAFEPGSGTGPAAAGGQRSGARSTVSGAPISSGGSFAKLVDWRLTPLILLGSLLLAVGFGAVHALGPGHGKTITAAYLVGAGAKKRQAMVVGLAVSLMHTGSVLALGLVFLVLAKSFPPERIYPWLELVTGLVALGLGTGLLVVRVRARRRGIDPWHPHTHPWDQPVIAGGAVDVLPDVGAGHPHPHIELDHSGPHEHGSGSTPPVSAPRLLALAVAGGILPSPTAFVVLLGAVRAHRIGYGLSLILAFSLGLAAALVFVGLFALRARTAISRRLKTRWLGLLPIGSAALILGFGLFFFTRGLYRVA
jgi:nickel/cobalt transporter (NicO) family protein